MTSEGKKENQKQEKESSPDQAKKETSLNQQKIPMVAFIPIVWAIIAMVITTFRSGYIQGFVEAVRTPEANGYCRFDPATNAHACEQRTSALFAPNGDSENATLLEIAADIDAMILAACKAVGVENPEIACAPHSGAVAELIHGRAEPPIYVVPRWLHFIWPTVKVGHVVTPSNVKSADPENPMTITTLSLRPRVFKIKNFMSLKEAHDLIEHNKPRLKRSTVGATATYDRTRFKRRAFAMLAMDHSEKLEDGLQVLNYQPGQYYKPHVDWLNPETEDMEGNLVPMVNNGTNRFATVFFYLNTVEEGGHTVFPRSYTHKGFDGNKVMRDGGPNPLPGYISDRDAAWACNISSSALRSKAIGGDAVLFYSQLPDGELDHESLHGGCPVLSGDKWAANLWVWNRPRDGSFRPKKRPNNQQQQSPKQQKPDGQIFFQVQNNAGFAVDVHWLNPNGEKAKMGTLETGEFLGLNSFNTHRFGATAKGGDNVLWTHVVKPEDEGNVAVILVPRKARNTITSSSNDPK